MSLVVSGLSAGYGRMQVVKDVSLTVDAGDWVGLIGRNGVGKTTLLSAICGLRSGPFSGQVTFDGQDISHWSPSRIARTGLVYVPDGHRNFGSLTVRENLLVAATALRGRRRAPAEAVDRAFDVFPLLRKFSGKRASLLSGGEQQMLSIAQALTLSPKVLVLDDPSSALAPLIVADIYRALEALRSDGTGLLVSEQDVGRSLRSVETGLVMNGGEIVLRGSADELDKDPRVAAIVLGEVPEAAPSP